MRMTLLHAITVVLAVLLFIVRHGCALTGIYSGKTRSIGRQGSQHGAVDKPVDVSGSAVFAPAGLELFLSHPKYKRDPEIDVDSEEIGYEPLL